MSCRILLVDDHQIMRQGLRSLLERERTFTVVGEASDGHDAIRQAAALSPDIIVMDLIMPIMNGLDAACEILRESTRRLGVILLTMHLEDQQILRALRAGVRGFVIKTQAVEELVMAIQAVLKGTYHLGSVASQSIVQAYLAGGTPPPEPLTLREREVLQLVAEGKATKVIASTLGVTLNTAETYRGRLMEKLDIHDTAGLVRYAIRQGLIHP